jgi:hypothetical protein
VKALLGQLCGRTPALAKERGFALVMALGLLTNGPEIGG